MSHYYETPSDLESRPHEITADVRGVYVSLMVDRGVFSTKGLDYGTRVLLETVRLQEEGFTVDLGCGYGAVTAVLARVYPQRRWLAVDVNERAVELAKRNLEFAVGRIRVVHSDGLPGVGDERPDAVLLNPPIRAGKAVIYRLFEESAQVLVAGGSLWIVMHKKHGAQSASVKLGTLFPEVTLRERNAGYHVFECIKGTK